MSTGEPDKQELKKCYALHPSYFMMSSYRRKPSVALARPTPGIMFAMLPTFLACLRVLAYSETA